MRPKVYITQDNGKNYSPAHTYGEPIFVTTHEYSSIANAKTNTSILTDIAKMAAKFNPDEDYLLASGDPIVIGLALHELLNLFGYVRILKWQSQDRLYVPVTINTQGLDGV